jgi:hypothetical protein
MIECRIEGRRRNESKNQIEEGKCNPKREEDEHFCKTSQAVRQLMIDKNADQVYDKLTT